MARALLGLILGAALAVAHAQLSVPPLTTRVTDLTGTLTRDQRAQLENQLASLERDKGAQIVILLLPSTQPETIEAFGIRLAEAWKIGRKGADDGVIVIVAKNDRAVRIEVGYGLEGAIPDAVAKRIIEERITPRFREGDFYGGLQAAADRLGRVIAGEALPAPVRQSSSGNPTAGSDLQIFILFALTIVARWARALFGLLGALLAAGIAGGLAWLIIGSGFAAAIAAIVVFAMSFARDGGRSGWHTGGVGGSWGGGGSGGGFSGGGGGFGGGGASGRW